MKEQKRKFLPIKKILVPTDFTVYSDHAIEYAIMVAREFEAKILLVHVIEPMAYSVTDTVQIIDHYAALKTVAGPILKNLQNKLLKKGLEVDTLLLDGTPYLEIVKKSRQAGIDLIIMGTHGRTGIKHVLMGSVAERVVRMAPCPVLTVRG
ncbi:MAG TPA: universal stress protein [Nitrospiria bacterium]|nr:universal stress protein [Nitrospiria bacterium]